MHRTRFGKLKNKKEIRGKISLLSSPFLRYQIFPLASRAQPPAAKLLHNKHDPALSRCSVLSAQPISQLASDDNSMPSSKPSTKNIM